MCVLENTRDTRVEVIAACVMPDHLHLLIRPRASNALAFVNAFKSWTTRLAWKAGHHGAIWQPGSWDRTMRSSDDLLKTVTYIVTNPVRAGLVANERDWPWTWVTALES